MCEILTVHGKPLTIVPTHVPADEKLEVLIGSLDVSDLVRFVQKVAAKVHQFPSHVLSDHRTLEQ